jgi:hypothetical protein
MSDKIHLTCRSAGHHKPYRGRCKICRRKAENARRTQPKRVAQLAAANIRWRGEVGSPLREARNAERRLERKAAVLAELEAARKHRASLREFITRRAA